MTEINRFYLNLLKIIPMKFLPKVLPALLILLSLTFKSQNLVTNPSFENNTGCPNQSAGWSLVPGWHNCNGITGQGLWGTPDYFNTCGTPVSNPIYNYVPPYSSYAYC